MGNRETTQETMFWKRLRNLVLSYPHIRIVTATVPRKQFPVRLPGGREVVASLPAEQGEGLLRVWGGGPIPLHAEDCTTNQNKPVWECSCGAVTDADLRRSGDRKGLSSSKTITGRYTGTGPGSLKDLPKPDVQNDATRAKIAELHAAPYSMTGCLYNGARGIYMGEAVQALAVLYGWGGERVSVDHEHYHDAWDEAEAYLNRIAPEGYVFGGGESGDFFFMPVDWWDEAGGEEDVPF